MSYTESDIQQIVEKQRDFFRSGTTLPVKWRLEQLKKLKKGVIAHEADFLRSLQADLGRSEVEGYLCDVAPIIVEINEMLRHLRRWARPECHFSGLMCFPSLVTKVYKMPYGVSLVISPFNFPILLTLGVVAASIAGGNTVVIKTSSKSAHCTACLKQFIESTFPPEFVTLIDGGHDVADLCLAQRFDKIFYTGSPAVGKHVLAMAANNLTPVTLELGGETGNWAIVRKDADVKDTARKIAFFKLCNAGQICININQVAVAEEIADRFLDELKAAFLRMIGPDALQNEEYPRLISLDAYDKCERWASQYHDKIVFGGVGVRDIRKFAPTILYPVSKDDDIVQHELFSPLLPVVPFKDKDINVILDTISRREHPLSMYLFTRDKRWAKRVMQSLQYGGGCINEVCLHLMVSGVPFNGTGHSGMGAYHGVWGFREFTHPSTVLIGSTRFNLSLREHPYGDVHKKRKLAILRKLER